MAGKKSIWSLVVTLLLGISCGSFSLESPIPTPETLQMDGVMQIVVPPKDLGMGRFFWSPDSTQLVFTYARTAVDDYLSLPSKYQILIVDIHSGEIKVVEESDYDRDVRAWLPDDRIAIFASGDLQEGIWLIRAKGSDPREFLVDSGQAVWSPDGQQMAFEEFEHGSDTNTISIILRELASGVEQEVFKVQGKDISLDILQWSPDGKGLLFSIDDGATPGDDIHVLDLAAHEAIRLTHGGYHGSASWSPDGTLIAYTYQKDLVQAERSTLYVMRSDGSCPTQLIPQNNQDVGWAMWSPDERWIAFTWNRGIYLLDTQQVPSIELLKNGSECSG